MSMASSRTPAAAAGLGTPARPVGCIGLIVESLIGLHLEVDKLRISPRLPASWTEFQIHYRYRQTFYHITICRDSGDSEHHLTLDGVALGQDYITVVDDGRDHKVVVLTPTEVSNNCVS